MRKNLLLLIMFCLIATIGAKATATPSGTTLTFTDCKAGDVATYLNDAANADKIKTITSLVVNGTTNSDDLAAMETLTNLTTTAINNGTTLTVSQKSEGNLLSFFASNRYLTNTTITSLIVKGPINGNDIWAAKGLANLTSVDFSLATIKNTADLHPSASSYNYNYNNNNTQINDNWKSKLVTMKFPKPATPITKDNNNIPESCFDSYDALENVVIPSGYTIIGSKAFNLCI